MTQWLKSTVDFIHLFRGFHQISLTFFGLSTQVLHLCGLSWAFNSSALTQISSWLKQYLEDLNRFNSWLKQLSRNCFRINSWLKVDFPGIDSDWLMTQDASPFFQFKSIHDSSEKHLILSWLMIWLWVIPMSAQILLGKIGTIVSTIISQWHSPSHLMRTHHSSFTHRPFKVNTLSNSQCTMWCLLSLGDITRGTSSQHLKRYTLLELVTLVTSLRDKHRIVHCKALSALTLKGYLFWWNQVSEVYEWKKLGMENMLLIKFGWKQGVKILTTANPLFGN